MEETINLQKDYLSHITKAFTNYKKSPKDRITVSYVETRLESLEQIWEQFSLGHQEILKNKNTEALNKTSYIKDDMYDATNEQYMEYKCELKGALSRLTQGQMKLSSAPSDRMPISKSNQVKLPRITIPTFSGKYTEWMSFRELFISLIHNNTDIDNVQKLHYLKAHLTGEPEQLLRHKPLTNDSYEQCWTLLKDRYNNKQYLGNCILKRFFAQKTLLSESATDIKNMLDCTTETLNALSGLGVDTSSWDIIVIYIVSQKLDSDSRRQWECKVSESLSSSDQLPTFNKFKDFLQTRYHSLEFIEPKPGFSNKPRYQSNNSGYKGNVNHIKSAPTQMLNNLHLTNVSCSFCKGEHRVIHCKDFVNLNVNDKLNFVQSNGLCFNCLGNNHSVRHCKNAKSCQICNRRHHSLLHQKGELQSSDNSGLADKQAASQVHSHQITQLQGEDLPSTSITNHFVNEVTQQVLLATAVVEVNSRDREERHLLRALIDQGSQASFITSAAVHSLGLKRTAVKGLISGLGGKGNVIARSTVEIIITSRVKPSYILKVTAYVLDKLTSYLPSARVSLPAWPELENLNLADPDYYTPNKIDMLLGAEVYAQIIDTGLIKCPVKGSPIAQNTSLGWILSGQIGSKVNIACNVITMHTQVEQLLRSFWEIESEPSNKQRILSPEEQRCEDIYNTTTTQDDTGRYIVRLPFRDNDPSCVDGQSREIALKRFHFLERKFQRDPILKSEYTKVFHEYLELNHMKPITEKESKTKGLYLPYHAVVRQDRETTKVRVVFDASCKGTNGVSLNDDLMVGPTLQPELRHLIMRWRMHPICFTADIVKMYRQVIVDERDTKYQRILWRENPEQEVQEYELKRVTFGTSSAPYLAVKSLCQAAVDDGNEYPLAASRVLQDFYMDDLMSGSETNQEAIEVYQQITTLLSKRGFKLQKWSSNSEAMLKRIKESNEAQDGDKRFEMKVETVNKILGLTWDRKHDVFTYSVQLSPPVAPVTKRKVISDISKLYDPLGWIAPGIIKAKIFIQRLWLSGIGWDEELPKELLTEWLEFRRGLSELTKFRLCRWTNIRSNAVLSELHGFCDASNLAFGAVVYLRVIDVEGKIHVSLLTAKTRVAPIKTLSIPRLELSGAVLLAQLLIEVSKVLSIPKTHVHAWTDSEVVLAWLSSHPSRWKTFIGNRVSEILTATDRRQWSHVRSGCNPADCASRGITPQELVNNELWLNGPAWLKTEVIDYKSSKSVSTNLEERVVTHVAAVDNHEDDDMWSKFSSLNRLLRVVAYCRRILKENKKGHTHLLKKEIQDALVIMINKCQEKAFSEDIKDMKQSKKIKTRSVLNTLNPYLDELGLLRVGGRLHFANIDDDQKHPIILPKSSFITPLVIKDAHKHTMHGGYQLMINFIRSKYWIIGLKGLVKLHVKKCITCVRYAATNKSQLMGQLPAARVTVSKAFLRSGVDYAGPINIRVSKGRGNKSYKGYICIFVCMSTRAIHLEAVSDLTSEGFLAAFKRFVARRGHCSDVYSDNGTNFVGAARELKILFNEEKSRVLSEISDWLATNGTQWHFIPPHAPNFGGLWEAGVRSCKFHLRRVVGDSTLTFEEMTTVLAQIESCLNSRPISSINNQGETMPLTPGHFLVGEPLVLAPDRSYENMSVGSLRRWQFCQRMLQDFWKRWSQEYLTQFLQRQKWTQVTAEPKIGDIVLVKEPDMPPAKWLLGQVVDTHPGVDGVARVVTLRCKNSLLKRPASRICVLPVEDN